VGGSAVSKNASQAQAIVPVDFWIDPPRFRLAKDEFVLVRVDQSAGDLEVVVRDPTGKNVLCADTLNGSYGPEDVPILAQRRGFYRLGIKPSPGLQPRRHASRILVRRKARHVDRERWRAAGLSWQGREANDPEKRINLFRDAVKAWAESGYRRGEADASYQLASSLASGKRWEGAKQPYVHAASVYRALSDRFNHAQSLQNLGECFRRLNDFQEADRIFRQAIRAGVGEGPRLERLRGKLLTDLGRTLFQIGAAEKAIPLYREALEVRLKGGADEEIVESLNLIGQAHYALGDFHGAFQFHWDAIRRLDGHLESRLVASTLIHLADSFVAVRDFNRAEPRYLWAIRRLRRAGNRAQEATAFNNLARAYFEKGRLKEALGALNRAIAGYSEERDFSNRAQALVNASWLYSALGQPVPAQEALRAADLQSPKGRPTALEALMHLSRSQILRQSGDLSGAIHSATMGVDLIESMRDKLEISRFRRESAPGTQKYYEKLIDLLMEKERSLPGQGWAEEALSVSERARARSLLEDLRSSEDLPVVSARKIRQDLLDEDSILLEYFLGDQKSYLWAATKIGVRSFELPARERLVKLAREVQSGMSSSDRQVDLSELYRKSRELSRVLLTPLGRLPTQRRLVFVVPAELQGVPFAALPNPFADSRKRLSVPWPDPLIAERTIVGEHSMSVLASLRQRRAATGRSGEGIAIFAAPRYTASERASRQTVELFCTDGVVRVPLGLLGPLNLGKVEARGIEEAASGMLVKKFLGTGANVAAALGPGLESFRFLHFSAHGHLDTQDPDHSAIVLSAFDEAGRAVNSCLFAKAVASLNLAADLVVLSTCGSGLGREVPGEGLIGLSQAFLTAGAGRLIVSLWNVQQLPTAKLMAAFYEHLLHREADPGEALRAAQLEMWRGPGFSNPGYWGAFMQLGDWGRTERLSSVAQGRTKR
jgi:CHAT domain-containing protein/Tfp pilus assembly protein PilF